MNQTIYQFKSGLRLVYKYMPGVRSVAVGVMTAAGSANENLANNGISHFIEHMFFKGTQKRNAFDIAAEIDGMGAQINAYTSKQSTCYYTFSVDENAEKCVEILQDILLNSVFDETEMAREKGVVKEEISMSEDDPADLCLEGLSKAYFAEHALGLPILGTRENVEGFDKTAIQDYIQNQYAAESTVISFAGNISFEKAKTLVETYFEGKFPSLPGREWKDKPHNTRSASESVIKDFEQADIALAFPAYAFDSPEDLPLQLFNTVFGGGMSSRLFQSLREKLGLAYSVYSYPSTYVSNGFLNLYVGTNTKMAKKAVETMKKEITAVQKNGITKEEFERGRRQLKGAYILGQESSSSLMRLYAKFALFADRTFDFDEQLAKIERIEYGQVQEIVKQVFDFDRVSCSYAGRAIDFDILEILKG